jgi:hypothetical protein
MSFCTFLLDDAFEQGAYIEQATGVGGFADFVLCALGCGFFGAIDVAGIVHAFGQAVTPFDAELFVGPFRQAALRHIERRAVRIGAARAGRAGAWQAQIERWARCGGWACGCTLVTARGRATGHAKRAARWTACCASCCCACGRPCWCACCCTRWCCTSLARRADCAWRW